MMQPTLISRFAALTLVFATLCLCLTARAQDSGSSPPASAVDASGKGESPPEPVIYLPYSELKAVFQQHGASVFLSFQDYLSMWEKAFPQVNRPPEQPPVGGVITSANYVATVQQDLAQIEAQFDIQILKEGWVEIPVTFGEAAVGSVTGEPGPVFLRGTGNGTYALLFSKPGQHKITLQLTARVRTAPEGRSFELQIPNVAITTFQLTVPDADQTIDLQPKLLQEPVPGNDKATQLKASLGSTDKVTVRWHPRVGTKPDMELLASATNATLITVADGLIHADSFFLVDVLRGQLQQLRVAVPKGQRILDVTSEARVKEWSVAEEAERQIITVELLSRQSGKIPLEVHTEWPLSTEPFDAAGLQDGVAHGIHLLDVLRESGQVALRASSDLVLNVTTQQGLARIDEAEVDARIKKPGASYFKFYSPDCLLSATAKPIEPRLLVDHVADLYIQRSQLKLVTSLNYTIERAGLFELKIDVPEGLTIDSVNCEGLKQYDLSTDKRLLTVVLRESRMGPLAVQITATMPRDSQAEASDLTVPLLTPENVAVETGRFRILAPEAIEVITDPTTIVGFQPDAAPNTSVEGTERLVSAWTFNRRPISMTARTLLKPTRLTAQVGTTADIQQGQVQVTATVQFLVEYAGLDTFRIAVPEALSEMVQISLADGNAPPIRQKSPGAAVDGWVPWTIVLQRDVSGSVAFRVTYDLQPTAVENSTTETTTLPIVRVLDPFVSTAEAPAAREIPVSRITGEVTAKKDRALSVTATATGGDVESIDVRELSQLPADGFVAFRYYQQPVELQLSAAKYDIQNVIEAVVSRGLVEAVLDKSGTAVIRGRFLTKSSERQRLRIDLPKGVEPLGAEIDGKSIALEKLPNAKPKDGWEAFLINVARTKSSDETFLVSVQYRVTLTPGPFQTRGGDVLLRLPTIGGTETAAVPVQQLRVVLWAPDEFAFVGSPEHFERLYRPRWKELLYTGYSQAGQDDCQSWIGGSSGGVFDFPTEGHAYVYTNLGGRDRIQVHWWHLPFYTWIVSGSLVLIAVILRNTSWENKLTILIVAAFLASAYALKDMDLVLHGLAVSFYGLLALIALWVLHGVMTGCCQIRKRSTDPPSPPSAVVIPPPGVFDSVTLGQQKPS
ncbi:hypothetical protein GC163_18810 [bacterium]|nr:hypothetical protein [bacterium]